MCKHWGLHISTNINCPGAVLGSFWAVWRGLLWCLKAKLRSWWFPRYWRFNKWYHSGCQLICLISRPLLIASGHDWYRSKGLLKGFKLALRPWESSKNWWRYGRMKFVTPTMPQYTSQRWYPDFVEEHMYLWWAIGSSSVWVLFSDCHDLAKQLSYYLYFFLFLFFSFRLSLRWSVGNIMWLSQSHRMVTSHRVTSHSHSI